MKFLHISDTHLLFDSPQARLDDTHKTGLEKFEYVLSWAQANSAVILHSADFFDKRRSWYLLPEIVTLLKKYKVPILAVFGQHDQYMRSMVTRHATMLGILEQAGLVKILGHELIYSEIGEPTEVFHIWGAGYGEEIPTPTSKSIPNCEYNILVIHAPIAVEPLWPGHNYIDAEKFLAEHTEFDMILCGDIHRNFGIMDKVGRWILNTGPMIRRRAVDYNFHHKPGFWIIDTEKENRPNHRVSWEEIPHLPAEKVLSRDHIEREEESEEILQEFVDAVDVQFDAGVDFDDNLEKFLVANNIPQSVIDILSETEAEEEDD